VVSELAARAGRVQAAKVIAGTRIPVLERAARLAQLSLALARPYDVPRAQTPVPPGLQGSAVYEALSDGQARVSALESPDPPRPS